MFLTAFLQMQACENNPIGIESNDVYGKDGVYLLGVTHRFDGQCIEKQLCDSKVDNPESNVIGSGMISMSNDYTLYIGISDDAIATDDCFITEKEKRIKSGFRAVKCLNAFLDACYNKLDLGGSVSVGDITVGKVGDNTPTLVDMFDDGTYLPICKEVKSIEKVELSFY